MLGLYALNLLTVHVEQPDSTKVKAGCSMIEIYIICFPFKPQNEKKKSFSCMVLSYSLVVSLLQKVTYPSDQTMHSILLGASQLLQYWNIRQQNLL